MQAFVVLFKSFVIGAIGINVGLICWWMLSTIVRNIEDRIIIRLFRSNELSYNEVRGLWWMKFWQIQTICGIVIVSLIACYLTIMNLMDIFGK